MVNTRLAQLRLEITREEQMPGTLEGVPALFRRWGLHKEPQECVWVVAYDSQLTVRTVIEVSRWSHLSALVHLPSVLAAVLTAGCERFILVHNHPNKSCRPSPGDKQLTKDVMAAANACGLYFEDHIILNTYGDHYSFTDSGYLKPVDYSKFALAVATQ